MSTEQYTKLLNQLQAWCRQDRGRQSLLATKLGVSRQLVSAWLNGSREMSLDEYFQIQEIVEQSAGSQFQKEKPMPHTIFEPPAEPRASTRDPNEPRTLLEAKEMIANLRSQLKTAPSFPTRPPAPPSSPAAAKSKVQPDRHSLEGQLATIAATRAAALALASRPIDSLDIDELRSLLNVTEDLRKRTELYNRVKRMQKSQRLERP